MGRKPVLDAISNSKYSLDLVIYGFTDNTLLDAIVQKKMEGKTVKIIMESSPYKSSQENTRAIAAFNKNNIAWQGEIKPFNLIHQKTLLIDDKKAIVMTFNFTRATFRNERNFALVLDDAERVKAIAGIFSADWNHVASHIDSADLIVSPDNSRAKLLELMHHAKSSLRVYAQTLNDYKIIGALANAARRDVMVEIILSQPLRKKQEKYLQKAGVRLHYSQELIIHAKVLIVDDKEAVLGSINLTHTSLDKNRELSVITRDMDVIAQLNEVFKKDWQG